MARKRKSTLLYDEIVHKACPYCETRRRCYQVNDLFNDHDLGYVCTVCGHFWHYNDKEETDFCVHGQVPHHVIINAESRVGPLKPTEAWAYLNRDPELRWESEHWDTLMRAER